MFRTVLVANRGEIARRVIRTLKAMGIHSVAVYSDADAHAPFVREADTAVRIGPAAAAESYLNIDAVLEAARLTGAEAIHPGYGFLSENVAFAEACAAAGITFIGPGVEALTVMADKITAKNYVSANGVPVVPGLSTVGMAEHEIVARARDVGYPLLVKPSAGGGGKGMQIVHAEHELAEAIATARRVAKAAFGDDSMLLERLLERPRHIEVQVLADRHGTTVHVGERECTLQRRHQKVIEEAPSAVIDDATRARIGEAAVSAAKSVNYEGAGTVEFLVAGHDVTEFFFIEMNTRLQVEHPVTELVAGIDLVEQQVRIAAGLELGLTQDDIQLTGHAIEARVYAEAPARGFLPATGNILDWHPSPLARNDAAVETGYEITSDYDPMIAKVIAVGADREAALATLTKALRDTAVLGVDTNIEFLIELLQSEEMRSADIDTDLLDRRGTPQLSPLDAALITAAAEAVAPPVGTSPWERRDGWRSGRNAEGSPALFLTDDDVVVEAHTTQATDTCPIDTSAARTAIDVDGAVWVHANGQSRRLRPLTRRERLTRHLATLDAAQHPSDPEAKAPMPGNVVAIHVKTGDLVSAGDRLITIEAMKMEHPVVATVDGRVTIDVALGEHVRRDQRVAQLTQTETQAEEPHV